MEFFQLFKVYDGEVHRLSVLDCFSGPLIKEGWKRTEPEALEAVKPAKTRKSKAVDDERGESNKASVAEDTGPGA